MPVVVSTTSLPMSVYESTVTETSTPVMSPEPVQRYSTIGTISMVSAEASQVEAENRLHRSSTDSMENERIPRKRKRNQSDVNKGTGTSVQEEFDQPFTCEIDPNSNTFIIRPRKEFKQEIEAQTMRLSPMIEHLPMPHLESATPRPDPLEGQFFWYLHRKGTLSKCLMYRFSAKC